MALVRRSGKDWVYETFSLQEVRAGMCRLPPYGTEMPLAEWEERLADSVVFANGSAGIEMGGWPGKYGCVSVIPDWSSIDPLILPEGYQKVVRVGGFIVIVWADDWPVRIQCQAIHQMWLLTNGLLREMRNTANEQCDHKGSDFLFDSERGEHQRLCHKCGKTWGWDSSD